MQWNIHKMISSVNFACLSFIYKLDIELSNWNTVLCNDYIQFQIKKNIESSVD